MLACAREFLGSCHLAICGYGVLIGVSWLLPGLSFIVAFTVCGRGEEYDTVTRQRLVVFTVTLQQELHVDRYTISRRRSCAALELSTSDCRVASRVEHLHDVE